MSQVLDLKVDDLWFYGGKSKVLGFKVNGLTLRVQSYQG